MSKSTSMDDIQNLFKETIDEFKEDDPEIVWEDELGYSGYDYRNRTPKTAVMGTAARHFVQFWQYECTSFALLSGWV